MANRRGKVEVVTDFIFLGSKITADGDYSHEIKKHLILGRKNMTKLHIVTLFNLHAEYMMRNAGLDEASTSWNQDCQEKYQ